MTPELSKSIRPAGRYTAAEVSRLLGVHRHTVSNYKKAGVLQFVKVGQKEYCKGINIISFYNNH